MKVRLILARNSRIHYATIEVPTIDVGWEIYVKFPNCRPMYVRVTNITVYDHKSNVDKALEVIRGKDDCNIVCNVVPRSLDRK